MIWLMKSMPVGENIKPCFPVMNLKQDPEIFFWVICLIYFWSSMENLYCSHRHLERYTALLRPLAGSQTVSLDATWIPHSLLNMKISSGKLDTVTPHTSHVRRLQEMSIFYYVHHVPPWALVSIHYTTLRSRQHKSLITWTDVFAQSNDKCKECII